MTTLFIDTSSNEEISVGLRIDGKKDMVKKKIDRMKSQAVLPMIDDVLKKHGLTTSDIDEIDVNPGPGSFTGLRVGIAIANTLSHQLSVPINGKKPGTIIDAVYF